MAKAKKRSYGEACRLAHALDLVGERWALLVVRELLLGPKRFTDLRRGLPNASTNILAERLRNLEDGGVIRKRKLPPPAAASVYELTRWGADLEPIVTRLGAWGARSPSPPCTEEINSDSIVLALRSLFDAEAGADVDFEVALRLDGDDFRAAVHSGELEVGRGAVEDPDATLVGAAGSFAAVLGGQLPLDAAITAGEVEVVHGRRALGRFLKLFPMPELAAA
ncbi:MAG TPA: winged helix-turn-helix transcriptional regulator [Solirubrobacterales bacterium]